MAREDFETAKEHPNRNPRGLLSGFFALFARYKPQIVVGALVVALLAGGAYYSSRLSESAPKVVYSISLDEAKAEAQAPLLVNVNTADAKELEELPGVGPSTAEKIIEYRRHNGSFKSVDELEEVQNYKSEREISFRALLTDSTPEVRFERVAVG